MLVEKLKSFQKKSSIIYTASVIVTTDPAACIIQSVNWVGYGKDDRGSIPGRSRVFFLLPIAYKRLSLLSNGYRGSLPGSKAAGA